ncbi:cytochrome c oxidase subunit II [Xenophilus sp. Marseille-Q4582]|uniref:cytochrome c oxidase subunit II n=1 Tax=Xenophilus sp. Marseille-Q4582 TaxID=2866600 RepID=UPI001CE458B6|nr:cytochrome c oxidase subunit II [Xenophilus sp. Marseille-Q4582]
MSALDPAGPSAGAIAQVWWWMFGVAALVWLGVCVAGALAMRRRAALTPAQHRRTARRWLIGGGLLLPGTAITALLVFGSPAGLHQLPWPGARDAGGAPLRVEAIGHQWWWEVHYPDSGLRLRNEMRIPAGRAIDVHTMSRDVIHSFWVPRLGGKLDAVPGRTLVVRLQADRPGAYRGVCAEFCGTGHAHMGLVVQAMPAGDFEAWMQQAQKAQQSQQAPQQAQETGPSGPPHAGAAPAAPTAPAAASATGGAR